MVEATPGCTDRHGFASEGWGNLVPGTSLAATAGHSLDPVELARGDVSRSKEVIAAAARDLAYHERWLKEHLASEERSRRRHARLMRREQARERRSINHQRMARSGRRVVLTFARSSRSIRRSMLEEAAYAFDRLRHLTRLGAAWVAPKAHALSSWTRGEISGALSWSGAKGRAVALTSVRVTSVGLSRGTAGAHALASMALRATSSVAAESAAKGRALAAIAGETASAGIAWTRVRSRKFARASRERAAIGGALVAARASALARASAKATSRGASWTVANGHHLALTLHGPTLAGDAWTVAKGLDLASRLWRRARRPGLGRGAGSSPSNRVAWLQAPPSRSPPRLGAPRAICIAGPRRDGPGYGQSHGIFSSSFATRSQ
jgi:hypothetical protein